VLRKQVDLRAEAFPRDACRMLYANPQPRTVTTFVGHAVREVESTARAVLESGNAQTGGGDTAGGDVMPRCPGWELVIDQDAPQRRALVVLQRESGARIMRTACSHKKRATGRTACVRPI
jgi:hypothetical protein